MSFSFLGYVHTEPISIAFVFVPVLAAGYLMGVRAAAAVGAVFGAASMRKASAYYVEAGDAVFSPVVSGRPLHALLVYSFMGGSCSRNWVLAPGIRSVIFCGGIFRFMCLRRCWRWAFPSPWPIILQTGLNR